MQLNICITGKSQDLQQASPFQSKKTKNIVYIHKQKSHPQNNNQKAPIVIE